MEQGRSWTRTKPSGFMPQIVIKHIHVQDTCTGYTYRRREETRTPPGKGRSQPTASAGGYLLTRAIICGISSTLHRKEKSNRLCQFSKWLSSRRLRDTHLQTQPKKTTPGATATPETRVDPADPINLHDFFPLHKELTLICWKMSEKQRKIRKGFHCREKRHSQRKKRTSTHFPPPLGVYN